MTEYLYRRNTVLEALRAGRRVFTRLWIQQDIKGSGEIAAAAEKLGVPIAEASRKSLSDLVGDASHQGFVLVAGPFPYAQVSEMLELAARQEEKPFLLLLDLLHGPHNIGALLRAAEAAGIHGVIVQDRRAPEITPQVSIYSAGAAEHLLIARETNLVRTMRGLKDAGIWLVGLDLAAGAQDLASVDLDMPIAIVVGHEGQGLRRLVRDTCDMLVQLPMRGKVDSLNAATAGAIMLYAAWQARGYRGARR